MVVNFILSFSFEEVNLDEDPCIISLCGHILTLKSMDGHMSMLDFYIMNAEGLIVDLKNSTESFSVSEIKSCPICWSSLRNLNCYSYIVRQALIDEATKKFIVWANKEFIPLVIRMQEIKTELHKAARDSQKASDGVLSETLLLGPLQLKGTHD